MFWRDLGDFLLAIWRDWVARITGSAATALLAVYEHLVKHNVSPDIFIWGAMMFFFVGAFQAWRQERQKVSDFTAKEKRPLFTINKCTVDGEFSEITLENTGARHAANFVIQQFVEDQTLDGKPVVTEVSTSDDIAPQGTVGKRLRLFTLADSPTNIYGERTNNDDVSPKYVTFLLKYEDQLTGTKHRQLLFRKWPGIRGHTIALFLHISLKEKELLTAHYAALLQGD